MNFSQFLTVQSWWEVPSIAYFCSLFRTAFKLLDFDIEELEEALLADGLEESASSLLTELIVRLLNGCLGNNDISAFNYQMYLRRIFRQKCQETSRYNPFNTDIDFQFLPLRTKVEILYALCDFRLDAEDVLDLFKNLEAESLRVEPLGFDDECSAYWYFYGTRLYREDLKKKKGKHKRKKKESRKCWFYGDDYLDEDDTERVWQVVCFTEADWIHLTERFRKATSKVEKELYRSLSQNFLPEIPRLFQEKERLQRKRLLETAPRRTSNRVLQKIKQKEEESKHSTDDNKTADDEPQPTCSSGARANRAKRRNLIRSKSESSSSSESAKEMPQKVAKRRTKSQDKRSKNSSATHKGEPPPEPPVKSGRKTNNSLASATGQIVIPDNDEPASSTRKKLKTSQIFSRSEEDIKTDMYKVLEQITAHDDAWPFMDPVEEEYAPNYYAVIRRPMDLRKMEERLDNGHYRDFAAFKADFKLIVNNCRLYNGQDNEYTVMVDSLAAAFDRLTDKYMHRLSSSDEEIAVEFQIPTPSRKHKLKHSESPQVPQKKRKRKSHSESEPKSSSSDLVPAHAETSETEAAEPPTKKSKESHKSRDGKGKKKRKGHHRRGKHSKKRRESKSGEGDEMEREERKKKKQKSKNKEKKSRQKKKKSKHHVPEPDPAPTPPPPPLPPLPPSDSPESSNRSRSASPLPSIRSESPPPSLPDEPPPSLPDEPPPELEPDDHLSDPDFFKDKYDKIKERRRGAVKDVWESLLDYKHKCALEKLKNLPAPEKDKNSKLRETIEKLKAKNTEKYQETPSPSSGELFTPTKSKAKKKDKDVKKAKSKEQKVSKAKETKSKEPKSKETKSKESKSKETKQKESKSKEKKPEESEENDDDSAENDEPIKKPIKVKATGKRGPKKSSAKNESATEALEEAAKDMSKWFESSTKGTAVSSPENSPAQTISTEEQDSRQDDELSQSERSSSHKRDTTTTRKRHASREPKVVKRREIQRTIDRLQPGKSKGNLLTNVIKKDVEKEKEESSSPGAVTKVRETSRSGEASPKLSLGSVLPTVEFTLGKDLKFDKKVAQVETTSDVDDIPLPEEEVKPEESVENKEEVVIPVEKKEEEAPAPVTKKDVEVETEPQTPIKPNQATPNLSAWFKAFGAPKSTPPVPGVIKKKNEDEEEKPAEPAAPEPRVTSPANPDTPNAEGGESPLPNPTATPRQRRTSTGSSVSERSSFSQDLDSPRHQMSLTSPLLRSPASPRDDFQKITYPIINGSVRAGFYQDTTSIRSSPEKSCSPREVLASPYSPYKQHVYAGNQPAAAGSATPQYFVDHNRSPLPTYPQTAPPYCEAPRPPTATKRRHDEYTGLGPENVQQNQTPCYSPVYSPFTQTSSNYPQVQNPPQPISSNAAFNMSPVAVDAKSNNFPMKKRTYNEPEQSETSPQKPAEIKEANSAQNKIDLPKPAHPTPTPPTSVDDIALALSEKSELAKLREKIAADAANNERKVEERDIAKVEQVDAEREIKKDANTNGTRPFNISSQDSIDMVNMGYMNPDYERRISGETRENDYSAARDKSKTNVNLQNKVYDVDAIALNLGINNQPLHKTLAKSAMPANAHSQPPSNHGQLTHSQQPAHSQAAHTQPPTHSQPPAHSQPAHTQPPAHSQPQAHSQMPAHTQPAHSQPPAHSQHLAHSQHPAHSQPTNSQPAHSQPAHKQHGSHAQPAHSQHQQPAHSQHQQPVHSQHQLPAHSQHQQPAHSQHQQPAHSQHQQPAHSQHQQPAHSQHQQPAHSQHQQPAHSQHQQPAHSQHQQPAHSQHQQPAHSQHQQPAHSQHQQPAHSQHPHADMNVNQHAAHSHHLSHYEHLSGGQAISNFSMSDIELANKKLYAGAAAPASAIDYGNWKLSQMRKQEILAPSDYSAAYQHSVNQNEKHKQDLLMSSNYNKNLQQQYNMYNVPRTSAQRTQELQQSLPSELRIPNPRGHLKNDHMTTPSSANDPDSTSKHTDNAAKNHKAEKLVQNHPLVTSNPYKTPYANPVLQLDSLRNMQNIPQMLERYTNEERFLSSFASSSSALYDKQFQMAQMFNKSMASEIPSSSASIYSQPSMSLSKDTSMYKTSHGANTQPEPKLKQKRKKRTSESKSAQITPAQQPYHTPTCTSDILSVKPGMMPSSSFNFGTTTNMATNMALSSGIYGDNAGFSAANQLMAANYMVAAVAHQQRSNAESDKLGKPAHGGTRDAFPFLGHGQVPPGYGFVGSGVEPSSPLYQQYLQRQEELLRQTGAQIMGLYPPPYPPSLGVSQPYDTINMNRHSWL